MRARRALFTAAVAAVVAGLVSVPAPAGAQVVAHDGIVTADPANWTPHVLDGEVNSIAQVGNTVILGGAFTQVQAADGGPVLARANVVAFDATTGAISTTFAPAVPAAVEVVLPAGDGVSVYLGGNFDTVNGVVRRSLARVNVSDGSLVPGFRAPSMNGRVRDLRVVGDRLWVAGTFGTVAGNAQPVLATLNATTGAYDPYMGLTVAGPRAGGPLRVMKLDVTPAGDRLVAVGNFSTVGGQSRPQLVMLDLTGPTATLANWATQVYSPQCASAFDTYVRDLDFSPDGSFFVVSTTGAYRGYLNNNPCDTTMRWETGATGSGLTPTWIDYTGGDTTFAVAVTGAAVYVGGHFRWQNNPYAGDRVGQGAVSREGIAALDPVNGLPLSWNPGRTKGVGVFDMLATSTGLWVASDTDRIGPWEYHGRIAYFPLAGGTPAPANETGTLPGNVFLAGGQGAVSNALRQVAFDGSAGSPGTVLPTSGITWSGVRGAMMIDDRVYTAHSDGSFTRRTFDGTTFGPAEPVNGAEQLTTFTSWRADAARITGMFFDRGRMYYTISNTSTLYYRYFTPESGVVGALRYTASGNVNGIDFRRVSGMFLAGDRLYWASSLNGTLTRMNWNGSAPVSGTATTVGGPTRDGNDWRSLGAFVQVVRVPPPNQAPTASLSVSCADLECSFDGSGSTDLDGAVTSYAWDFGDGATATGPQATHAYAAAGEYTATLTVTDDRGATGATTQAVTVAVTPDPEIAFVGVSALNANQTSFRVTVPDGVQAGDGLLLIATTATTVTVGEPAGLTGWQVVSSVSMGGSNGATTVWQRVAADGDAGRPVTLTLSAIAKTGVTLLAYTGTSTAAPVLAATASAETINQPAHTAPAVTVPGDGSLVVSYWADRSSTTTAWTAPLGETLRSETFGVGGGHISTLVTDSGAPVPAGDRAGLTATADVASPRASMITIVLAPRG
jgi:PKD repeat protein